MREVAIEAEARIAQLRVGKISCPAKRSQLCVRTVLRREISVAGDRVRGPRWILAVHVIVAVGSVEPVVLVERMVHAAVERIVIAWDDRRENIIACAGPASRNAQGADGWAGYVR